MIQNVGKFFSSLFSRINILRKVLPPTVQPKPLFIKKGEDAVFLTAEMMNDRHRANKKARNRRRNQIASISRRINRMRVA